MGQLIEMNGVQTMSSLEIAELTGKDHKNVLADARRMLAEIQSAEKLADYKDGRGRAQPCLMLDKEESLCLVTGYSAKLRMAVIKRWQELEDTPTPTPQAIETTSLDFVAKLCETNVYSRDEKREMIRKVAKDYGCEKYLPNALNKDPRSYAVSNGLAFDQAIKEFVANMSGTGRMSTEDAYLLFCSMYGTGLARRLKFVAAVTATGIRKRSIRFEGISKQGFIFH